MKQYQDSTERVVIRDSRRDFEFSPLSFSSRSFSGQDKMIKINEIIDGSVTFE